MEEINVKVGDEVLYTWRNALYKTEKIAKVTKITPTGRIRTNVTDRQFDKYGRLMGTSSTFSYGSIKRLTEEDRKRLVKKEAIDKAVKLFGNSKLTYEQAEKIIEILEDDKDGDN